MNETKNPPQTKSALLVVRWFTSLFKISLLLVAALVLSIVVEWIGLVWFWPDEGVNHSALMVKEEISFLAKGLRVNPFIDDSKGVLQQINAAIHAIIESTGIGIISTLPYEWVIVGGISAINIANVFMVRLAIMILSTPTFILFGVVGLVRGLADRSLRKWGGGRESAGLYHLYYNLLPETFFGVWFIYLALPVTLNPIYLIGPSALLCGLLIRKTAYRFKKYV